MSKTSMDTSLLRRDPVEAAASCRREGWQDGTREVFAVFTHPPAGTVRVIMQDGRSGTVEWDPTAIVDDREAMWRAVIKLCAEYPDPNARACIVQRAIAEIGPVPDELGDLVRAALRQRRD